MGRTIISKDGRFEWDEEKDAANVRKHTFSFDEILEVFDDPMFCTGYDEGHSVLEDRYFGIGCLSNIAVIVVFFTERGKRTRIFSARRANPKEAEAYYDYVKKING